MLPFSLSDWQTYPGSAFQSSATLTSNLSSSINQFQYSFQFSSSASSSSFVEGAFTYISLETII
jgi:hypothetical protein